MAGRWSTSAIRQWLGFDLLAYTSSSLWSSSISILRWPASQFTASQARRWVPRRLLRLQLPELDFSIVDDVVWSLVTAFESVALVSMLAFFFLFCGCTV